MAQKKEPVEIACSGCNASFRLWVPEEMPNIRVGIKVSCVLCGARYSVRKVENGFDVKPLGEAAPAPAEAAAQAAQVAQGITDTILMIEDDKIARAMAEN